VSLSISPRWFVSSNRSALCLAAQIIIFFLDNNQFPYGTRTDRKQTGTNRFPLQTRTDRELAGGATDESAL
jgi:hypothetical protein